MSITIWQALREWRAAEETAMRARRRLDGALREADPTPSDDDVERAVEAAGLARVQYEATFRRASMAPGRST